MNIDVLPLLFIVSLLLLQISANLADRESCHLAAADTVKKAEEKLQPVKVLLVTEFHFFCKELDTFNCL